MPRPPSTMLQIRWYPLLLVALPLVTLLLVVFSFQTIEQTRRLAVDSATQVADEVSLMMQEQSLKLAEEQLAEVASTTALQIRSAVTQAVSVASTLARVFSGMQDAGIAADVGRDSVNSMLQAVLESNRDFLAAYTIWEPDAFDMLDLAFANAPGHDASGRFIPYWCRTDSGLIELSPARNYSQLLPVDAPAGAGEYYQRVRREQRALVLAPWLRPVKDGSVPVISVVIPVFSGQKFVGVAGIDLAVQKLQQQVDRQVDEYLSGEGQLTVLSDSSVIVAMSGNRTSIGQAATTLIRDSRRIAELVKGERRLIELDEDNLAVLQPLKFGTGFQPWGVYLSLPRSRVEAGARDIHEKMMADVREIESSLNAESQTGLWRQGAIILVLILFAALIYRLMRSLEFKERDLRHSEGRLQALLDNASAVIYMKDPEGRYLLVNRRWLELFHVTQEQVIGFTDIDLFPADVAEKFRANDILAYQQQQTIEIEEEAPQDDGLHTYISLKFPVFDSEGHCYATCGVSTDITERKKAEQAVQRLNEQLEQRVEERTWELSESLTSLKSAQAQLVQSEKMAALGDLVGGIAHEVNTPLGNALTAASSLKETVDDLSRVYRDQKLSRSDLEYFLDHNDESADILMTNLQRAVELIENFKEVSVDQKNDELRSFEVRSYLQKVIQSLKPKFKHTSHQLLLECPQEIEVTLHPGALAQIVTNLVMNSLVHGFEQMEAGIARLRVSREEDLLVLDYSDNGCGMDEQILARIYEPFVTTRRGQGGSGLGMNIVYNLVTRNPGGLIECHSKPGQGVSIHIRLPLQPGDRDQAPGDQ